MQEINYVVLQQRYGGRYVARRGDEVIASANTYDELCDVLENARVKEDDLIVEYVEPVDTVGIY